VIQIEKSYLDAEFMLSREGIDPRQAILISQELVLITMFSDSSVIEEDSNIEETVFNYTQNKKEEELHALLRKVSYNLPRVVLIRYCVARTKGDRF
jgi:hypothetical protein